jgi:hypothetical protein
VKTVIKQCKMGAVVRVGGRLQQNPQRPNGVDIVCNSFLLESAPSTLLEPSPSASSPGVDPVTEEEGNDDDVSGGRCSLLLCRLGAVES